MHEVSLVRALLTQVDEILREHDAGNATGIEVEIGPLSGVETELVKTAFDQLVGDFRCSESRLTVRKSPLVIRCSQCGIESKLQQFDFYCGECGSGQVRVIGGDEFRLLNITVEESAHA